MFCVNGIQNRIVLLDDTSPWVYEMVLGIQYLGAVAG